MAEYHFDLPVRLGVPLQMGGLTDGLKSGRFATVVGLLIYGLEQKRFVQAQREQVDRTNPAITLLSNKVKELFKDLF
jgi:cell division ATPase FtsA